MTAEDQFAQHQPVIEPEADMTQESEARGQMQAKDWHRRHHHEHHHIQVKAFELWDVAVKAHGVDYGAWYYWFLAEFELGIRNEAPLPPPVE